MTMYLCAWTLITGGLLPVFVGVFVKLRLNSNRKRLLLGEPRLELGLLLQRKNSFRAPCRGSVGGKWTGDAGTNRSWRGFPGKDVQRRCGRNHCQQREPGEARLVEIADPEEADDVRKQR